MEQQTHSPNTPIIINVIGIPHKSPNALNISSSILAAVELVLDVDSVELDPVWVDSVGLLPGY